MSSIKQCWDTNPQPSEDKSPRITTRPIEVNFFRQNIKNIDESFKRSTIIKYDFRHTI